LQSGWQRVVVDAVADGVGQRAGQIPEVRRIGVVQVFGYSA
jgi:hypothetical protein